MPKSYTQIIKKVTRFVEMPIPRHRKRHALTHNLLIGVIGADGAAGQGPRNDRLVCHEQVAGTIQQ